MRRLIALVCMVPVIACNSSDPQEWDLLFDGKTLQGWHAVAGSAAYSVEDGAIAGTTVAGSPNSFLVTDRAYENFILEMEVKIEDSTINSGVQFRSQYDQSGNAGKGKLYGYQFELDPSVRRWTGGIYDQSRRGWLYPLSLHPEAQSLFKPGEYNSVRIECIGNTIQTFVNGSPAAYLIDSVDRRGLIALQVHSIDNDAARAGKKVYWKNIRIKTNNIALSPLQKDMYIVNTIPNYLSPEESAMGWKLLFDGKTNTGWKGAYKSTFPEKGWKIHDGEITVLASDGRESTNGGDIVTDKEYSTFDLSFEFKLTKGANSGVKYFVTLSENNKGSAIGLEYQVLDDQFHPDAKKGRNGNRTLSSLYDLITSTKQARFTHPTGEWNRGRVVVYPDNRVEHWLNGIKVVSYQRGSEEFRKLVAESKYNKWPAFGEAAAGHILLQDHGNEVSFRSIRLKELK